MDVGGRYGIASKISGVTHARALPLGFEQAPRPLALQALVHTPASQSFGFGAPVVCGGGGGAMHRALPLSFHRTLLVLSHNRPCDGAAEPCTPSRAPAAPLWMWGTIGFVVLITVALRPLRRLVARRAGALSPWTQTEVRPRARHRPQAPIPLPMPRAPDF